MTGPSSSSSSTASSESGRSTPTPRGTRTPPPLAPQTTGEWTTYLPALNLRESLLGGKSLNRFSSFVTTGAEDWVLNGTGEAGGLDGGVGFSHSRDTSNQLPQESNDDEEEEPEQDEPKPEPERHFVEAGPAWKSKLPAFHVTVHSPTKRTSPLTGAAAYTIYHVTSIFTNPANPQLQTTITVHRRFSHFVFLHTALTKRLPGIALPPLPEKQYAGRFSDEFVEARRADLERYLSRVVRHPVARYAEVVTFFLSCEDEQARPTHSRKYLN